MHTEFRSRRVSRRAAVTAKVGTGAAVAATAVFGSLAMPSGPAGAVGPPGNQPPVTTYSETCDVAGLLSFPVTVNFFGRAPGAADPGAPVVMSATRSTVTIPSSFVNLAVDLLGLHSLSFTINSADMDATNTVQGTENTLPAPVPVTVPITANQPATFQLPSSPATVGPWTAGSSGTIAFTPGNTEETALGLPITCSPTSEPVLGTTVIRAD